MPAHSQPFDPDFSSLPGPYEALADLYFTDLRIQRLALKTQQSYWQALTSFCAFLEAHELKPQLRDTETGRKQLRTQVRMWLDELTTRDNLRAHRPLSAATVANRQRSLAAFFTWLVREQHLAVSPMASIPLPRLPKNRPPIVSDDDLAQLLQACVAEDKRSFYGLRDLAVILTLIDTGLRRSEIGNLAVEDLDFKSMKLLIRHGKGDKERRVPIGDAAARALKAYKRARAEYSGAEKPLPVELDTPRLPDNAVRHPLWLGHSGRLTPWGIAHIVAARCTQAGLPPINPHRFRHTFAHNWLLTEGGIDTLCEICGWESPAMAYRYGAAGLEERAQEAQTRRSLGTRIARQVKR